jgi:hypothetical protein
MEDRMNTPAIRAAVSVVSVAALLSATLALGGCARGPSPATWDETAATPERLAIRFDNEAQTYVDLYLVGEQREWWLGRVAAGAVVTLRIPEAAFPQGSGFVRLAALAGAQRTSAAARDPRATLTLAQPASALLGQRWTFLNTAIASPALFGAPVHVGRP